MLEVVVCGRKEKEKESSRRRTKEESERHSTCSSGTLANMYKIMLISFPSTASSQPPPFNHKWKKLSLSVAISLYRRTLCSERKHQSRVIEWVSEKIIRHYNIISLKFNYGHLVLCLLFRLLQLLLLPTYNTTYEQFFFFYSHSPFSSGLGLLLSSLPIEANYRALRRETSIQA